MKQTHDEFFAYYPVPDQHSVQRHPKVHPDDVLHDLYHAPEHRAKRATAQHGHLRRRVWCDGTGAKFPQVSASIRASSSGPRVNTGPRSGAMLEKNDEVLCRVECKVLDTDAEIVDDEPRFVSSVARQSRGDQPARRAKFLECLDKEPTYKLVRVAVPR